MIAGGLFIFAALLLAVSFLLPKNVELIRRILIDAPPDYIFEEINDLENWSRWAYWFSLDPNSQIRYSGPKTGAEASCQWKGEQSEGQLVITESRENKRIGTRIDFIQKGEATMSFEMIPDSGKTSLVIGLNFIGGDNLVSRWNNLLIRHGLTAALNYNLSRLKELAEAKPRFSIDITEESLAPTYFVRVKRSIHSNNRDHILSQIQKINIELSAMLIKYRVQPTGRHFCLLRTQNDSTTDIEYCIPISPDAQLPASIPVFQHYSGSAIMGRHKGPYGSIEETYEQVKHYIEFKGYRPNGSPWEVYITDPAAEKDPNKWIAEVYYPVIK
jgi:effector-binding domain-containing protein